MPRPQNSLLHGQFNRNNSGQLKCNNENCNGKILNKHSGNLERHLKKVHPKMYSEYMNKKRNSKIEAYKTIKAKLSKTLVASKCNFMTLLLPLFCYRKRKPNVMYFKC